jgi:hypothetical protein
MMVVSGIEMIGESGSEVGPSTPQKVSVTVTVARSIKHRQYCADKWKYDLRDLTSTREEDVINESTDIIAVVVFLRLGYA